MTAVATDIHQAISSSVLHHAKVKLWEQDRCLTAYPTRLKPSMICAGYEHGEIDACKVMLEGKGGVSMCDGVGGGGGGGGGGGVIAAEATAAKAAAAAV